MQARCLRSQSLVHLLPDKISVFVCNFEPQSRIGLRLVFTSYPVIVRRLDNGKSK